MSEACHFDAVAELQLSLTDGKVNILDRDSTMHVSVSAEQIDSFGYLSYDALHLGMAILEPTHKHVKLILG